MMLIPLSPEQLREALDGDTPGSAADGWRALREDVRALAPPLDHEFERRLGASLRTNSEHRQTVPARIADLPVAVRRALSGTRGRALALGLAALACVALIAAAGIFSGGSRTEPLSARVDKADSAESGASSAQSGAAEAVPYLAPPPQKAQASPVESSPSVQSAPTASARVQEQAASITLATKPTEVQSVADGVSRLASSEGGYVVNSQVNVQSHGKGEATLTLSLPSAHLAQALAALGRLAPVRAQSNSLQDITSTYEDAKRALADAAAERSGLLRALSRATTQGQIESLRRRLSLAGGTIARDTAALHSVSQRAIDSRVEVSVLAASASSAARSTLSRGLDDAGHVLAIVLVGLLIALAVLVPLGLLGVLAALAGRHGRRWQRERVLGQD